MLAKRLVLAAVVAGSLASAFVVTGCGNAEDKLIGTYKGELKLDPKQQAELDKNPMAAMAKTMLSGVKLELKKDHKFALNIVLSFEGTWKLDGEKLQLTPETMNGKPIADFKKQTEAAAKGNPALMGQAKQQNSDKPMVFAVGSDGTLKMEANANQTGAGMPDLTFKKEASN